MKVPSKKKENALQCFPSSSVQQPSERRWRPGSLFSPRCDIESANGGSRWADIRIPTTEGAWVKVRLSHCSSVFLSACQPPPSLPLLLSSPTRPTRILSACFASSSLPQPLLPLVFSPSSVSPAPWAHCTFKVDKRMCVCVTETPTRFLFMGSRLCCSSGCVEYRDCRRSLSRLLLFHTLLCCSLCVVLARLTQRVHHFLSLVLFKAACASTLLPLSPRQRSPAAALSLRRHGLAASFVCPLRLCVRLWLLSQLLLPSSILACCLQIGNPHGASCTLSPPTTR